MDKPNAIFVDSRPDASRAMRALKRGVRASAWVVSIAAFAQLLLFGFVHFTEIRWTEIEAPAAPVPEVVMTRDASRSLPGADVAIVPVSGESGPVNPNRVLSRTDTLMRRTGGIAVFLGVAGVIGLACFATLGAVVSGGSGMTGVEKAVSACSWSLALLTVTVPWREALASVPIPGVFSSYDSLVAASESVSGFAQLGPSGLFGVYLLMPVVALTGAVLIAYRFNEAVELGFVPSTEEAFSKTISLEMDRTAKTGVTVTNNAPAGPKASAEAPAGEAKSGRPF